MIEQLRMRRRITRGAEVVDGAHQAFTHQPAPHAVHDDARGERVVVTGNPFGQFQPATLIDGERWRLPAMRSGQETARDLSAKVVYAAANVDWQIFDLAGLLHACDHDSPWPRVFELLQFGLEFRYAAGDFVVLWTDIRNFPLAGTRIRRQELHRVGCDESLRVFSPDENVRKTVGFEVKLPERNKSTVEGRGFLLVDVHECFALRVEDRH